MEEILIFLFLFSFLTAVIVGPSFLKSRERMKLIELVRASTDKGQPIPPEVLTTLVAEPKPQRPSHVRDIRKGVILLAVALAFEVMALCAYVAGRFSSQVLEASPEDVVEGAVAALIIGGLGAIPLCVGIAFVILGLVGRKNAEA